MTNRRTYPRTRPRTYRRTAALGSVIGLPGGTPMPPLSGLLRAWDPSAVADGSNITSIPAAYGTSSALTVSGNNTLGVGSPALRKFLKNVAANSGKGLFTATTALAAFTLAFIYTPSTLTGTTPVPIIGHSTTTTQGYLQFNTSGGQIFRAERRTDAGTAGTFNFATAALMNKGASYLCIFTYDGATLAGEINGAAAGSVATTGTFTFDQLFSTKGAFADGNFGRVLLYDHVLSTPDLAAVRSTINGGLGDDISTGLYISDANGDDTNNTGVSSASPIKTIALAEGKTQILANALALGDFTIHIGDLNPIVGQPITAPSTAAATAKRLKYAPYSEGGSGRAKLYGCTSDLTGWTFVTSDALTATYTKVVAYQPNFVQYENGSGIKGKLYTKLYDKTKGGAVPGTYFDYSLTVLTVVVPLAIDPRVVKFYIAANDSNKCATFGTTNIDFTNLDMFFWNSITFHAQHSSGTVNTYGIQAGYGFNDGIDASSSSTAVTNHFGAESYSPGGVPNISGTQDCFSCHAGSTVNYYDCIGAYGGAGLRSERHTNEYAERCQFFDNTQNVLRLDQGSGTNGYLKLYNCYIGITLTSTSGNGVEIETPSGGVLDTTVVVEMEFVTVVNISYVGQANAFVANNGTWTIKNSIGKDCHGGALATLFTPVTEDYNVWENVAFPTAGGVTSGGHSITTADAQLNANDNYRPAHTSVCRGAGLTVSGIPNDGQNAVRPSPPTIGWLEAA